MNFLKSLKEKTNNFAGKLKQDFYSLTRENEEISKKKEEEEQSCYNFYYQLFKTKFVFFIIFL